MSFSEALLDERKDSIIAFCGGRSRRGLIRRLTEELVRRDQKVILTALKPGKLPPFGQLVLGRDPAIVRDQIIKDVQQHNVFYCGKHLENNIYSGFTLGELRELTTRLPASFRVLIDLNEGNHGILYPRTGLQSWKKDGFWQRLVYCIDIGDLGRSLEQLADKGVSALRKAFGGSPTLTEDFLIHYLTDAKRGVGPMIGGKFDLLLYLDGVNRVNAENRTITLSRELSSRGWGRIVLGSIDEDHVKRIN